jgi:hypothetical protein
MVTGLLGQILEIRMMVMLMIISFLMTFVNQPWKLQQTHEFVSANINERHDKAAVEASMAKQEDEMAQAAPSSQPTQAVTSSKTSEGKLAFIVDVLCSLTPLMVTKAYVVHSH